MRIGILGPTNVGKFCKASCIGELAYIKGVIDISKTIASTGHEIILVPQKKSISETFALEYRKAGGKKVIGMIPMDDTEFGIENLNQDCADEIINCVTWRNQPWMFAQECDVLISLGFGAGTLGEVFATKYFKVEKVIIIEDFITSRLPKESERDINIEYVKAKEVSRHL